MGCSCFSDGAFAGFYYVDWALPVVGFLLFTASGLDRLEAGTGDSKGTGKVCFDTIVLSEVYWL